MLFRGTHLTDASGSLVGVTYSHNRGGPYTRGRAIPVNPNTTQQQAVKSFFATLQAAWNSTVSAAQRAAWDAYALGTPLTNRLGSQENAGGKGMYTRGNVPRLQASLTRLDAAPSDNGLPALTGPTITSITASTGIMVLGYTNSDSWATAAGGALLVYTSRPQSPSINSFKGPYRFAGKVVGAATPPTSPANITLAFTTPVGKKIFVRCVAVDAQGRLSADFRLAGTSI